MLTQRTSGSVLNADRGKTQTILVIMRIPDIADDEHKKKFALTCIRSPNC